jgi:ABC-type branched-subunit amino acid transport system ATPase component
MSQHPASTEHNMEFIMSLASEIVVMHQGKVLTQGAPDRVQSDKSVIDAYLG